MQSKKSYIVKLLPHEGKMKLFLCSFSFKEGDLVENMCDPTPGAICSKIYTDENRHADWDGAIDWVEDSFSDDPEENKFSMGFRFDEQHWFKPLGLVSNNAVWVKSGMTFDKEEIQYSLLLKTERGEEWVHCGKQIPEEFKHKPIQVLFQCPTCKTFH